MTSHEYYIYYTVRCYCYCYCRIDAHFVIKITDFGLSEDVYARNYFRQGQGSSVKLPVKWMAACQVDGSRESARWCLL